MKQQICSGAHNLLKCYIPAHETRRFAAYNLRVRIQARHNRTGNRRKRVVMHSAVQPIQISLYADSSTSLSILLIHSSKNTKLVGFNVACIVLVASASSVSTDQMTSSVPGSGVNSLAQFPRLACISIPQRGIRGHLNC